MYSIYELLRPAHRIPGIFDGQRILREHQRMKSVDHHRQFLGLPGAETTLNGPGMRPVRDAPGMQGDHPPGDMFAAHKIAVDIIQELIAVDIAVIVWSRN